MPSVREVLAQQSREHLQAILAASPRKAREEVFRRLGIKPKASSGFRLAGKAEARVERLHETIVSDKPLDEELLAELVRGYLYNCRPMLKDALDFLDVPNNDGLTDAELDFVQELPKDRTDALRDHLRGSHSDEDVNLYLSFLGVP